MLLQWALLQSSAKAPVAADALGEHARAWATVPVLHMALGPLVVGLQSVLLEEPLQEAALQEAALQEALLEAL